MGGSFARTILPATMPNATYDSNNRLTNWNGKALNYDVNGNLTSDGTYTYTWNARDQLTGVQQGNTLLSQYAYDAAGRRYSRTLNGSTTNYLYDGLSAVQEKAGATTTDLFGVGVDNYFSKTDSSGTQTYLKDALGSTLGLADNIGNLRTTYTYGPYGQGSQTGTDNNSNQYTGREKDAGNLYYYRARYYSTEFNRFISQDPIGLEGGINWYAYVEGDPVNSRDPSGMYAVVRRSGSNVSITIPINFYGPGATRERVNAFINGIESRWSGNFGEYNVTTTVRNNAFNGIYNSMYLADIPTPSIKERSHVNIHNTFLPWSSTTRTTGIIYSDDNDWVAAHEAGHMMGLADRYDYESFKVANDWAGNIMANRGGTVDRRNIEGILAGLFGPGPRGPLSPRSKVLQAPPRSVGCN